MVAMAWVHIDGSPICGSESATMVCGGMISVRSFALEEGGQVRVPEYFDFEVSLREVQPRIWRRFLIRSTGTFMDLHEPIQDACGWLNCHLFAFRTIRGRTIAGLPYDDGLSDPDPDAAAMKFSSFFGLGKTKDRKSVV